MTSKSSIAVAMYVSLTALSFAEDVRPQQPLISQSNQREVDRRAIGHIRIEGNHAFSSDSIRSALQTNDELLSCLRPSKFDENAWTGKPWQEYSDVLQRNILAGYVEAGFLDASVTARTVEETDPATVVVEEGTVYTTGNIRIKGVADEITEGLRHAMQNPIDDQSLTHVFLKLIDTKATSEKAWPLNEPASTSEKVKRRIVNIVDSYMRSQGFAFAESSANFVRNNDQHVVDLHIVVTPRTQNRIRDIRITGLQQYSEADVRQIINVETGIAATPDLCEAIEASLTGSGRFLFAKCDTQTPFGPEQEVAMHIRVREYEEVLPETEFSKIEQAVLRHGEWLSAWQADGPDFIFEATIDARKFLKTINGFASPQLLSISNECLSSLRTLELRLVISPEGEAILTVKGKDAEGNFKIDHTLAHSTELSGIVSYRDRRSWLVHNSGQEWPTCTPQLSVRGADPEDSEKRLSVKVGFSHTTQGKSPVAPRLHIEATALLCGLTSKFDSLGEPSKRQPPRIERNADGREVLKAQGTFFTSSIDVESGRLITAEADSEAGSCTITFQRGQLQKELAYLQRRSAATKNFAESGSALESAIDFLTAEVNEYCTAEDQPVMMLWAALLDDKQVQDSAAALLTDIKAQQSFKIPRPDADDVKNVDPIATLYWFMPRDSALRETIRALAEASNRGSTAQLQIVMIDAMGSDRFGPISCAALAGLIHRLKRPEIAQSLATVGHQRLAADGLFDELKDCVAPGTFTGTIARSFVCYLQKRNEEELDHLINALKHTNFAIGQQTIPLKNLPLRVGFTAIHSHQSHDPQIVIHDQLRYMCAALVPLFEKRFALHFSPSAAAISTKEKGNP